MSNRHDKPSTQGKSPEILIGIMHVNREPWLSITQDGQSPSWKKSKYQNFSVIYFFGNESRTLSFIGNRIESMRWNRHRLVRYGIQLFLIVVLKPWAKFLPSFSIANKEEGKITDPGLLVHFPEITATMRWKKLSFLQYFLDETDAEFVIISNTSSILQLEPIVDFLNTISNPDEILYAGRVQNFPPRVKEYVSGCFTIMNRKSATLLIKNRNKIPVHMPDDVVFGKGFERLGVAAINLLSIDLNSVQMVREAKSDQLSEVCHFRLKSSYMGLRNDVEIMQALCEKLYGK